MNRKKECTQVFYHGKSAIQILLRSSLFSYAATAVFLLLLAFGMYRFSVGEGNHVRSTRHLHSRLLSGRTRRRKKAKKAPVPLGILCRRPLFSYFSSPVFLRSDSPSRRLPHPCCFPSPSAPEAAPSAVCLANAASDWLNRYR